MIDHTTIRRIAFIKYLYGVGIGQSKAPEPLAGASLLTFHDSVEIFLQLASEQLNIGGNRLTFLDYFSPLSEKLASRGGLAQKESMRRLNSARNALKHSGTLPSKLDIEAFRASTTAFFQDNIPIVFDISFDEISLIDFVQPESAQIRLRSAHEHLCNEQLDDSLGEIAIAFEEMLYDYEERKRNTFSRSPFFFGHDLTFQNSFFMGLNEFGGDQKLSQFVDRVQESIKAMQSAIKILALGLDYRRYTRFKLYIPSVVRNMNASYRSLPRLNNGGVQPTKDDVQYCLDFVVEAAIHLHEFDYDVSETRMDRLPPMSS